MMHASCLTYCRIHGCQVLVGDPENSWTTTLNGVNHEFHVRFTKHTVRLTSFAFCTSPDSTYETEKPLKFLVYGYDSATDKWEIIYVYPYIGKVGNYSRYLKEIENKKFFQIIAFHSIVSPLSFSYIEFYGDVKNNGITLSREKNVYFLPSN